LTLTMDEVCETNRIGRLQYAVGTLIAALFRHWPITLSSLAGSLSFVALAVTIIPDQSHTGWVCFIFRFLCHQKPERSFFLQGRQVPLCERCLALYLGIWLGGVIFVLSRRKSGIPQPWVPIAAWIPLLADAITQWLGFRESNAILRVWTGALAGIVLALFVLCRISNRMDQVQRTAGIIFTNHEMHKTHENLPATGKG
jgi:uncharacterized membrane protein